MELFYLAMLCAAILFAKQAFIYHKRYRDVPLTLAWILMATSAASIVFSTFLVQLIGIFGWFVIFASFIPGSLLIIMRQGAKPIFTKEEIKEEIAKAKEKKVKLTLKQAISEQPYAHVWTVLKSRASQAVKVFEAGKVIFKGNTESEPAKVVTEDDFPLGEMVTLYGEYFTKEEFEIFRMDIED